MKALIMMLGILLVQQLVTLQVRPVPCERCAAADLDFNVYVV
jgi:hypothetical protein